MYKKKMIFKNNKHTEVSNGYCILKMLLKGYILNEF